MAAPFPPEPLKIAADEVAALLKSRNETISVAETAAGGLISAALLATPGASAFYKGGLTVRSLCLSYAAHARYCTCNLTPPKRSKTGGNVLVSKKVTIGFLRLYFCRSTRLNPASRSQAGRRRISRTTRGRRPRWWRGWRRM